MTYRGTLSHPSLLPPSFVVLCVFEFLFMSLFCSWSVSLKCSTNWLGKPQVCGRFGEHFTWQTRPHSEAKRQTYGQLSNHEQRCNWKNFSLKKQWKIASAFGPRTLFLLIRVVNTRKIFGNLTSTTRWRPHKMKCVQTNRTLCCTHIQGIYKSEIYEGQILRWRKTLVQNNKLLLSGSMVYYKSYWVEHDLSNGHWVLPSLCTRAWFLTLVNWKLLHSFLFL